MVPDSEQPRPARRSARFGLVPWFVALVVAYVLSVGPAVVVHSRLRSKPLQSVLEIAYLPLSWLSDHSDLAQQLLVNYVEWWLRVTGTTIWG